MTYALTQSYAQVILVSLYFTVHFYFCGDKMKTLVDGIHQLRGMLGFTLPETEDCSVKVELIDVLFRLRLVREEVIVNKDHRLIFDLGLRTPAFISRCGKIIQLCSVPTCYEKQENVFYNLSLCSDHVKCKLTQKMG